MTNLLTNFIVRNRPRIFFPVSKNLPILLIVIFTAIIYCRSIFNGFQSSWDDQWAILGNPFILDPSFESLKTLFTTFYYDQYAPFNVLFYYFLHQLFGFNASIFHGACLLIHLINIVLVYKIIQITLQNVKPLYSKKRILSFSVFTSLIFAIHPLQVESVAWNSASKIVLYTFFYLLSIIFYLKLSKQNSTKNIILISILYIIALGFKEQAIILPVTFLTLDYLYGRFKRPYFSVALTLILKKSPFFIIALLYWYFSASFEIGSLTIQDSYPLLDRLLFGIQSMCEYIFRFIAPVKLFYFYPFPYEKGGDPGFYSYINILFFIIIIAFFIYNFLRKNRILFFGFLFFIVNIFLVLHIIPVPRKFITADRYMYVAIIGLSISLWWIILYIFKKFPSTKVFLITGLSLYFLFLSLKSVDRIGDWKNSRTLKENVTELIKK